jgi:hypothetical protein
VTRSRIILRLALGVLCGVALVMLPAVFSTAPATEPLTSSTGTYARAVQPTQTSNGPASLFGLNGAGLSGLSLLTIILFIFLPSTVFSIMVRRWAESKARDYLWSD